MTLVSKAFSDIVTFSRSSNATRIGSNGLVQYAPHNLLQRSQEFDNAYWTKGNTTVTANAAAGPDGTITADKAIISAATAVTQLYGSVTGVIGQLYTVSVYAKKAELQYVNVGFIYSGVVWAGAQFDLNAGTVVRSDAAGAGSSVSSATISSVGNGWYRCSVVVTSGFTTLFPNATPSNTQWTSGRLDQSLTGDGTSGIYLWGAQLSVGPLALDYTPTTTAAVYGPRFDYDPSGVTSVDPIARNLLTYSEQFDNAAWTKPATETRVDANVAVSPSGATDADKLVELTGTTNHAMYQQTAVSVANGVYTVSVYMKAAERQFAGITICTNSATVRNATLANLSTGAVAGTYTVGSPTQTANTVTNVGNGWVRITATAAHTNNGTVFALLFLSNSGTPTWSAADAVASYTGDGTSGVYIWGAQLEVGSTATAYMVSGATNGFRAVPVVSGSATARGLLVEEQRTNLLTYSEQFDNAAWAKGTFGATQTVTANAGAAPDGTVTAEQVTLSRSNAATDYTYLVQAVTLASTAVHAASVYLKAATSGDVGKQVALWQFDGTVKNVALITLTADWQRYSPLTTSTLTSGGSREPLCIGYRTTAEGGGTQTGSVSFFIWGAQAELGSFNTSYIPTLASTVTRSADVASVDTLSPWFNATEGTLYTESVTNDNGTSPASFVNTGSSDIIGLGYSGTNTSRLYILTSGVAQANLSVSYTGSVVREAAAYKVNDAQSSANGTLSSQDTSVTLPSINKLNIGYFPTAVTYQNGWIRRLAYFPRRLSSAELQALTA